MKLRSQVFYGEKWKQSKERSRKQLFECNSHINGDFLREAPKIGECESVRGEKHFTRSSFWWQEQKEECLKEKYLCLGFSEMLNGFLVKSHILLRKPLLPQRMGEPLLREKCWIPRSSNGALWSCSLNGTPKFWRHSKFLVRLKFASLCVHLSTSLVRYHFFLPSKSVYRTNKANSNNNLVASICSIVLHCEKKLKRKQNEVGHWL